jgi:hypothetical protein
MEAASEQAVAGRPALLLPYDRWGGFRRRPSRHAVTVLVDEVVPEIAARVVCLAAIRRNVAPPVFIEPPETAAVLLSAWAADLACHMGEVAS